MDKPRLLDVVRLKVPKPEHGLRGGETGTIVFEFEAPDEAYEVEFADDYGETVAMFALTPDEFDVVWRAPIREQAAT
jgi:hypothetical protein